MELLNIEESDPNIAVWELQALILDPCILHFLQRYNYPIVFDA